MIAMRLISLVFLSILLSAWANAEESIERFLVEITVQKDGDIEVKETLEVRVEGKQIRRGIFRDLPAYYRDEQTGGRLPYRYSVKSVRRNGENEPEESFIIGNARQIRIGDADIFLPLGVHTYEITYTVKNQIRYFEDYDELYWNITGNYWAFPIKEAEARICLLYTSDAADD